MEILTWLMVVGFKFVTCTRMRVQFLQLNFVGHSNLNKCSNQNENEIVFAFYTYCQLL